MTVTEWDIGLGEERIRDEIQDQYGGATNGGIEPSNTTPNIFVFTDPSQGPRFGYIDGWIDDRRCFQYTAQGKNGDQMLTNRNKSLLEHKSRNRSLRLFLATSIRQGTQGTRNHAYIGEFEVDSDMPFFRREAPDESGALRSVIVFRLLPVGEVLTTAEDTDVPRPPRVVEINAATAAADREARIRFVEMQANNTSTSSRRGTDPSVASRTESDLVDRYQSFLEQSGHEIVGCQITPPGQSRPLFADLFDNTTSELCEAKSSAERGYIRTAIGQLLDYGRHAPHESVSILVPARPDPDLLDLLSLLGITCVYERHEGTFERIAPSGTWPLQSHT